MKNYSHRSEKLDAFINKNVRVTFFDDSWSEGVLLFKEKLEPPLYLPCQRYYVLQNNGVYMGFAKTTVKRIENIKRELS